MVQLGHQPGIDCGTKSENGDRHHRLTSDKKMSVTDTATKTLPDEDQKLLTVFKKEVKYSFRDTYLDTGLATVTLWGNYAM